MNDYLPVIGITMGDAAGVGPEIIVKSLASAGLHRFCRPLVIGDAQRLEKADRLLGGLARVRRIEDADEARFEPGVIDCIDLGLIPDDGSVRKPGFAASIARNIAPSPPYRRQGRYTPIVITIKRIMMSLSAAVHADPRTPETTT